MEFLQLPETTDKYEIFDTVATHLGRLGIQVASTDFNRPWGGFFVIDDVSTEQFIEQFFPGYSYDEIANGLALTPKILIPAPEKRLSWQYHHRREEIWSVVAGPVGIATSEDDVQGDVRTLQSGDVVSMGTQMRHRLIGLETFGVVAEFWKHTDPSNPSDEDDIIRVQDDFSRAA
jgi:mannose-6-phosphate isomerase-like protein (cupin superfamily)